MEKLNTEQDIVDALDKLQQLKAARHALELLDKPNIRITSATIFDPAAPCNMSLYGIDDRLNHAQSETILDILSVGYQRQIELLEHILKTQYHIDPKEADHAST